MSDKPTGEWTVRMGDTTEQVHIESYFPKGYDPDAEPWKSIREFHKKQLTAERENNNAQATAYVRRINELREQLAAERERMEQSNAFHAESEKQLRHWQDQLAAEREKNK